MPESSKSDAMSIIDAAEAGNPDHIKGLIHDIVDRLLTDAGVEYERVSKRGEHYSIADETYNELASWFDYRRNEGAGRIRGKFRNCLLTRCFFGVFYVQAD